MDPLRLVDVIDREVLQKLQDSFASALRLHVVTRDASGQAVTEPSQPTQLARLAACAGLTERCGAPLTPQEAEAWDPESDGPFAMARFVEPVGVPGACLGSIEVLVLLVGHNATPDCVEPADVDVAPDEILPLLQQRAAWGADELHAVGEHLRSISALLSSMCLRGSDSARRVRELTTLQHAARLMSDTMDLQERLDILTRIVTTTLGVRSCLIRLLDEEYGELAVKSVYNLSHRYLEKGPVNLCDNAADQAALNGDVVYIPDVLKDPRTIYSREAAQEGLCSSLCVALRANDRAIGTIRVYTAQPRAFTDDDVRLFQAIASQAAAAIEHAALYGEALRAQAMDRELAVAADVQEHLLPRRDPVLPGFDIASRYIPYASVGGDFYDFVPIQDQHLGIVIADVSGKGIPGAILMAATRAVLRGHIDTVFAARDIIAKTNRSLCHDIGEDQFITLFYAALDTLSRRLTYCNAGHAPPLIFRDGSHCFLVEGGLVLGVDQEFAYDERQFTLLAGDVLVFYTDGLTETMDPEGNTFDTHRVVDAASPHLGASAEAILDGIWHAVCDFARGAPARDDFTIIVLKCV